jgi:hypothetical protein
LVNEASSHGHQPLEVKPLRARSFPGISPAHWARLMFRIPGISTVFADDVTALEECRLFMPILVAAVDIAKRFCAAHAFFCAVVVDRGVVGLPKLIEEELRSSLEYRGDVVGHDYV